MFKRIAAGLCFAAVVTVSAHAADTEKLDQRILAARDVVHELMNTPDKGIPQEIVEKATCVVVVPGFKKGAFVFGGQYGQGVATCRTMHGWSAPAFVQLTGASFGLQIGGESTDLVLVGVTHDSAERLLHEKLKLGGDVAVAAGPVGRNSQASAAVLANAGFLSYSRNKGIFAGINLSGDVLNQNTEDTESYYGHDVSYERILHGDVRVHASAEPFVKAVAQMFRTSVDH
jgi:lipid-binding SYLF domain-containing protein